MEDLCETYKIPKPVALGINFLIEQLDGATGKVVGKQVKADPQKKWEFDRLVTSKETQQQTSTIQLTELDRLIDEVADFTPPVRSKGGVADLTDNEESQMEAFLRSD